MVQLIGVMSELGAGTRGASLGLDAMRIASYKLDQKFFLQHKVVHVPHENHLLFEDIKMPYAKRLDGISTMYGRISRQLSDTLAEGKFPVVLSGDHSNAGGTIAGITAAFPGKRLGVIWIDAHADIHSPYTSPSGNVHGMPLATALGEDNLDCKIKNIPEETRSIWNALKGEQPRVQYEDLVYMGVRDYEKPEEYLMIRHRIANFTVPQCRELSIEKAAKQALEQLQDCEVIYVSFDVDSMDPSVSRGTGTPVPGGFTEKEAQELLGYLLEDSRLVCWEITEVNPVLDDKGNAMGEAAFRILKRGVKQLENKLKATS